MPKVRKEIPELEKLVQAGRNLSAIRGAQLYSMDLQHFFEKHYMVEFDKNVKTYLLKMSFLFYFYKNN